MRLSETIEQIPEEQQYPFYRKVKSAIRDGTLSAVPLTDSLTLGRTNKPLTVLDHYFLTEPTVLTEWIANALQPAGKRAVGAARFAVEDPSQLTPEELQRRAEEYRTSLGQPNSIRKAR